MASIGGKSYTMGDAVINVYINHEKKFAFVEMRTVEEASNAMALDGISFQLLRVPTKVVCLTQAVGIDDLNDDGEYDEIMQDMRTECEKFGTLVKVVIPRPGLNGESVPGVGKVFLEYAEIEASSSAKLRLNGRKFLDSIVARFYPEDRFARGEYDN